MDQEALRLEFQQELENIPGVKKVYFQPPPDIKMEYPCIRYSRSRIRVKHASNSNYIIGTSYDVIVIDRDPDSSILDEVQKIQYSSHDSHYTTDGLHHDKFTIYRK